MAGPLSGVGQQPVAVQQNTDSAAAREQIRPGDDEARKGVETAEVAALQTQDTDTEDSSLVDRRNENQEIAQQELSADSQERERGSIIDKLV